MIEYTQTVSSPIVVSDIHTELPDGRTKDQPNTIFKIKFYRHKIKETI